LAAHGCGDRHCPACQYQRTRQWLEHQRRALLPVRYFHWVFTLPAALRPLALQNPAPLYGALFDGAAATLLEFGQQRFAAELGLTAVLHTWGQNLMPHPHLHCLVTGGGLTAQDTWAGPDPPRWRFPVQAVAKMFQGKFIAALLQLHTTGKLQFHGTLAHLQPAAAFTAFLAQLAAPPWVVFAKGSVVGPDAVLEYLGRYTHHVALSNRRLRTLDPHARTLTFRYKDYAQAGRVKPLTLTGTEFLRRFRCHLLPHGFTKVRHYGLLANHRRHRRVALARTALEHSPCRFAPPAPATPAPALPPLTCPHCQGTHLCCVARLDVSGRGTLFFAAARLGLTPGSFDSS
jgi:hypothetical protein